MRKELGSALVLVALFSLGARAETITFEEPILQPNTVSLQYCNLGVEFIGTAQQRIFDPPVVTSSPPNALTNDIPGDELGEYDELEIRFTAGQSKVSFDVGLHKDYDFVATTLLAQLYAFSSPTPGTGLVASDIIDLGTTATPITRRLSVATGSFNIRSVLIRFREDAFPHSPAFEAIDNLNFNVVGPPCGDDSQSPTVLITEPATDAATFNERNILLGFTAADDTRVAQVDVTFLDQAGVELSSFSSCGGDRLACPTQASFSRLFFTELPLDTVRIRVTATDFFGRTGSADRLIDLALPGPDMNLWAESVEITQATQPWLPVNATRRAEEFEIPTFGYPDLQMTVDAVPLVAGRTTVVRLTAGVEDTIDDVPVVAARALLRCFIDIGFGLPCPGPRLIRPESRPPASLREITVDPADDLETKRRDLRRTWNFVLPRAWVDQVPDGSDRFSIFLEAEVDSPAGIGECDGCEDGANRMRVTRVPFRRVPRFSEDLVADYRVRRLSRLDGDEFTPPADDVQPVFEYLRRIYPVDETTVDPSLRVVTNEEREAGGAVECSSLVAFGRSVFPSIPSTGECCASGPRIAVGFQDGDLNQDGVDDCSGFGVFASPFGYVESRIGFSADFTTRLIAQANGSRAGRSRGWLRRAGPAGSHNDCGGSPPIFGCEEDWPWPHGMIGEYGFDVADFEVIPPDRLECRIPGVCDNDVDDDGDGSTDEDCVTIGSGTDLKNDPHDLMSTGGCRTWISSRTWIRLFNGFTQADLPYQVAIGASPVTGSPAAGWIEPGRAAAGAVEDFLMVGGIQDDGQAWTLLPAQQVSLTSTGAFDEGSGSYRIELQDAAGLTLAGRNFDLPLAEATTSDPMLPLQFYEQLPAVAGAEILVLSQDGQVLAQRSRSASAPVVTIVSPGASGFDGPPAAPVASWTGSDADGDMLTYRVDYRPDPVAPWQTLATNLETPMLEIVLDDLEGSDEAQLQVVASDGFNTTVAVSVPFAVAGKAPRVEILAPTDGALLLPGQRSVARGLAFDLEDGSLADDLVWSSDLDGVLGTGRDLDLAMLHSGFHQITLAATDSDAQTGVAAVTVEVEEGINSQPVADAGPDQFTDGGGATLDGRGSTDANGDPLDFHWTIVGQPTGGDASLSVPTAPVLIFSATVFGVYEIALVVDDGQVESNADTTTVLVCGQEVNDGVDNECPDDPGFGSVDNISGDAGFMTPASNTIFSWTEQAGATRYQVARANSADFSSGCVTFASTDASIDDPEEPSNGAPPLYYLVRPLMPLEGSWGQTSAGTERTFVCGTEANCDDGVDDDLDGPSDCDDPDCAADSACLAEFSFVDTGGDDVQTNDMSAFFQTVAPDPSDWILFEITADGRPPVGFCSRHADFYRDRYLALAGTGGSVSPSPFWISFVRDRQTGDWIGGTPSGDTHTYGSSCFLAGSWCPAQPALSAVAFRPAQTDACEAYSRGCGDGTWELSIRISPNRRVACGF